jgi:drug/metabolite transporter (DMT)-like permease
LGFYDLARKHALRDNAVMPVLFFSIVTSALVWAPLMIWAQCSPESYPLQVLKLTKLSTGQHGLVLAKAALVASSWVFGYFAIKHLPLSIASPIRSTSPLWTVLMAVSLMGEAPTHWQWAGIVVILAAFYAFSLVGKLEGIHFHRDKWVGFMVAATLLGACSSIYDKHLLQVAKIDPPTLQAWFSIYLVVVMLPLHVMWRRGFWQHSKFHWSWAIPMIGLLLLAADFLYFTAIAQDGALIAVISPVRRASVIIPFLGGILPHREKNFIPKLVCILILLGGVALIQMKS